ncbi:MFS transporter [Leptolyngbya sp. AN02str]|uniref:MFS transporter n=1 Tax=Leptolyngbya sp. AN02str TaxID=3423363 RepID=UPI003D30FBEC
MNRAKQTVAMLIVCQALAATSMTLLFTVAALVGRELSANPALATLPLALLQLAVMAATIPASLLMQRVGRSLGFGVGTVIGMVGAGLGAIAIFVKSFPLFCLATVLVGVFNGFSGFYRFAAADAAEDSFRAQAISLVVAGGVVAAVLGPNLANVSKDWFPNAAFVGSFLAIVVLQLLALPLLALVKIPQPLPSEQQTIGRSLSQISQQPTFRVAVLGSMVGYGVMALLMTATPLAMVAIAHPFHSAASVIQWHVLGMFAPSFFTGFLIARFGVLTIVLCGVLLNLACVGINLAGTSVEHFHIALTLLGLGWNFMFVGSSTLLTETYIPTEEAKTQAMHDFLMMGFVALSTFLSGQLLEQLGWGAVNLASLPLLLAVLVAVLWLMRSRLRSTVRSPLSRSAR